jgi:hypothetical protein
MFYKESQKGAMYEETIRILRVSHGDQHLAAVYCTQQKQKTEFIGEFLHEFSNSIRQLAHCALPALPEDHFHRGTGKQFGNGIRD